MKEIHWYLVACDHRHLLTYMYQCFPNDVPRQYELFFNVLILKLNLKCILKRNKINLNNTKYKIVKLSFFIYKLIYILIK